MTEQLSELVEQRRKELADLEAERLRTQNETQHGEDSIAMLDELERLDRQIAVEKSARDRASIVRETVAKRLGARLQAKGAAPAQSPAPAPAPTQQAQQTQPKTSTEGSTQEGSTK